MKNELKRETILVPPEPTYHSPYRQIEWIWERYTRRIKDEITVKPFFSAMRAYIRFLTVSRNGQQSKEDPRFYLSIHWDHLVIHNAERFWRHSGLSVITVQNYIHSLIRVVEYAADNNLTATKTFIYPDFNINSGMSIGFEPYNENELEIVRQVIQDSVHYASKIISGYQKVGVGTDPRRTAGKSCQIDNWTNWDNVVWFFENILNCEPRFEFKGARKATSKSRADNRVRRQFIRMARDYHGGIDAVWRRLGVSPMLNKFLIVPLVMKLAWETGLNPSSIVNLKRDCYQEHHPVTGLPFIKYFKARSRGEKELHLDLMVSEDTCDLRLLPKQIEIIRDTISLILKLTQPLVKRAKTEDKNCLLLVEVRDYSSGTVTVSRIGKSALGNWSRKIKANLKQQGIETLKDLNLARFRPTKITELVTEGIDFFSVQAISGHANMTTTWTYLDNHRFLPFSQLKIANCLEQIYLRQIEKPVQ